MSPHTSDGDDYEYDDYGVDDENIPDASMGDKTAAAVAAALSLSRKQEQESLKRARRPVPRIDFERLMGARGFKHLRRLAAEIKYSGHTESDLAQLMRVYKEWADFMFPKMPFRDVLERIDRLSKTHKSLRIYIRALKEAQDAGQEFDETAFLTQVALAESAEMLEKAQ